MKKTVAFTVTFWKPSQIHCSGVCQSSRRFDAWNPKQRRVEKTRHLLLALDFVHVQLKIDRDDPKLNQPRYLMDKALAWRRDDDALGSFNKKLMDELNITNQECRDRLVRAADSMSEERLRTLSIVHPGEEITLKAGNSNLEGPTGSEMQDAITSTSRPQEGHWVSGS